jgi:hypothetical protein
MNVTPSPDGDARLPPPRMTIAGNDPDRGHWWNEADLRAYGDARERAARGGDARLPELPAPAAEAWGNSQDPRFDAYTADQMRTYGEACAAAAIAGAAEPFAWHRIAQEGLESLQPFFVLGDRHPPYPAKYRPLYASPPPPTQAAVADLLDRLIDSIDVFKGHPVYDMAVYYDLRKALAPAQPAPAPKAPHDDGFNGDTPHLIRCIHALLNMDAKGALVPHGVGGHARALLTAAASRLAAPPAQPAPAPVDAPKSRDRLAEAEIGGYAAPVDEPVDVPSPSDVHLAQAQGQAPADHPPSEAEADCLALMKFYGARTLAELVNAQAHHIEKLQAKLPPTPSLAAQRAREG